MKLVTLAKRGLSLASNQVLYSLLDRKPERNGVLDVARELGITIIAYSPLAQGILTGRFHADPDAARQLHGPRKLLPRFRPRGLERTRPLIDELNRIAGELGATPAQVALAWTVRRNDRTVVAIPGASSQTQCRSNVAAGSLQLDPDLISSLDQISDSVSG